MKRYGQVFLLAIGFDLYWTLVVLFREQGLVIWFAKQHHQRGATDCGTRMKRYGQVFLLAIGFDLYWTLVVLFREQGLVIWFALAVLAWLMLPPSYRGYALVLAVTGGLLDTLWALTGLITFTGASLMPLWMMALWLMFACVWTQLTRTTTLPGWLLTALATLGGPVAYLIGERLGAITFQEPTFIVISWMIPGWLVLMLFFHLLMGRQQ